MTIDIKRVKICVTIPTENVDAVRNVICEAGGGVIGNYSFCSTSFKGIGTFKPNDNANPYIGEKNKLEFVDNSTQEAKKNKKINKYIYYQSK